MKSSLLSQRIKELRKVYNYTQDYVAEVLGITRQTYSHYETGRRTPSADTIFKLAALYNISVDDLLRLSVVLDKDVFYEAPITTQSSDNLASYLSFFNDPKNQKKYLHHSNLEKELLYYFHIISEKDKRELIEIAKIKTKNNNQ